MTWIFSIIKGASGFSGNSKAEDVTDGIDGIGLTAVVTGASGFSGNSKAEDVTDGIDGIGLTAVVTGATSGIGLETARVLALRGVHVIMAVRNVEAGATSGIGLETARVLALRGVHVIMAVRNVEAGQKVKASICEKIPNAKLDVMELDLSSQASVGHFASDYISKDLPLNILILNAGIMSPPFTLSKDNIELQFATNHIGNFLLTNLLLDTLKKTANKSQKEGRIVIVSSELHKMSYNEGIRFDKINDEKSYSPFYAYGQSKLANALHAKELARRLKEEGANVTVNSLHPGVIKTNLSRNQGVIASAFSRILFTFLKNIPQGAATSCYVALHPQVKGVSGEYFADSNISKVGKYVNDQELAKKLWDSSLELTQPK